MHVQNMFQQNSESKVFVHISIVMHLRSNVALSLSHSTMIELVDVTVIHLYTNRK